MSRKPEVYTFPERLHFDPAPFHIHGDSDLDCDPKIRPALTALPIEGQSRAATRERLQNWLTRILSELATIGDNLKHTAAFQESHSEEELHELQLALSQAWNRITAAVPSVIPSELVEELSAT